MNIEKLIQETVQETTKAMFKELKKRNMLKSAERTAWKQTETILFNYPKFENAIRDKLREIDTIKKEGVSKRSGSVLQCRKNSSLYDVSEEIIKAESAIANLENSIQEIESYLSQVDNALAALQDDPYFEIIRMKYFEGQTREDIAEYFEVDASTISRNRNRLVNLLQIRLFSDECIFEMGIIA